MIIRNLPYTIFALLSAGILGAIFLLLCAFLYIGHKHINTISEHLKNCPAVAHRGFLLHMGAWGKIVYVGSVSSFLAFPDYLTKKGALCANDISTFPSQLKKILIILHHINWILVLIAGICAIGVALSK